MTSGETFLARYFLSSEKDHFSLNLTPEKAEFLCTVDRRDTMEWVQRFRAAGAAADLDDLGVEVDDDVWITSPSACTHCCASHGCA